MSRTAHIVVVDDDAAIRRGISKYLVANGLRVSVAADGAELQAILDGGRIDLILLDVMLPGHDGLTWLKRLQSQTAIPVILVTAVTSETDRVIGLEIGAEDYICKPFSLRELLARVRVVLRRRPLSQNEAETRAATVFRFDAWIFDVRARTLTSPTSGYVELTTGEFELLQAFVEHPNRVLSRDQLLDLARGRASLSVDRAIDVQVMRLRRKLEADPQNPLLIKTVRNGGYIFTPDVNGGGP